MELKFPSSLFYLGFLTIAAGLSTKEISANDLELDVQAPVERSVQELLPAEYFGYLEIPKPSALMDLILEHPIREKVESHPLYQKAMASDEATQFKAGVKIFEAGYGKRWRKALREVTFGGIYIVVGPTGNQFVVETENEEVAQGFLDYVFSFMESLPDTPKIKREDVSGETVYKGPDFHVVALGKRIVLSESLTNVRQAIERFHDQRDDSLLQSDVYLAAAGMKPPAATAWGHINTDAIRGSGFGRGGL